MNKILIFLIFLFISVGGRAQIIEKGETKTAVNAQGDTLLVMNLSDARTILADLLDKQIVDSVLTEYEKRDSVKDEIIAVYKTQVEQLQNKIKIQELQIQTLTTLNHNKNTEITMLDRTIIEQKKEIKRQKRFKVVAIMTAIATPIAAAILILAK